MGMYYSAVIVVGLPRHELLEKFEDLDEILEEGSSLEIIAPIFDGYSDEEAIIGFTIQGSDDYQASELDESKLSAIPSKMKDFFQITGLKPKVWLSPQCT